MIRLNRRPSTDAFGVKRWRFPVCNGVAVVTVFERSAKVLSQLRDPPYLIRLDHASGLHLDTCFAVFKSQAEDKAQWLEMRYERGQYDAAQRGIAKAGT